MDKLELLSASELGELVNNHAIKPSEVISYFEKRILSRNKSINAFVYTKFKEAKDIALKQDKLLENGEYLGPFAGVPFGLKDFLPNKIGWESSHGGVKCLISKDTISSTFDIAMEKLGGIPIGKTNAPSYGFRGTTDNKLYGVSKNPFNLDYNTGGSSGGSAGAVCDGLCLIAEGGDAGGSIRIPAAFCSLYGFKAGISLIPSVNRPDAFSATHPYCFNGGLTKTVLDSAILLNQMVDYDSRDPNSRINKVDYVKEMKKNIKGKRIAYTLDFDIFEVEDKVKEKFLKEIQTFKKLGLDLDLVHFKFKHSAFEMATLWCKGITVDCAIELNLLKEKGIDLLKNHKEDFPDEFIYYKNECDKLNIMDLYEFNVLRSEILDQFENVFENYDYIISPISTVAGILNSNDRNTKGPKFVNNVKVEELIGWTETFLVNFVGHPSCSLPAGLFDNNIPFGIQVISKKFHEGDLLALSYQYEKIKPWRDNYLIPLNRKI